MTGSVQGRSKNIQQEVAGFQYQGNAPIFTNGTLTAMSATTDSAVGTAIVVAKLRGVIVRVTAKVSGDDATLGLKVGDQEVEGVEIVVANDSDVGTEVRLHIDSDLIVPAGAAIAVTCDGEATAGAAALVAVLQPL